MWTIQATREPVSASSDRPYGHEAVRRPLIFPVCPVPTSQVKTWLGWPPVLPLAATEPDETLAEEPEECVFPFTAPVVGCKVVEAAAGCAAVVWLG